MFGLVATGNLAYASLFSATVPTTASVQLLIDAGRIIGSGLEAGRSHHEIGRELAPLVADLQAAEGYEAERGLLGDLVTGKRFRRRDLKVIADGFLTLRATGLPELEPTEALAQYRQITNPALTLLRGVFRPRTERIEAGKKDVTILFTDLKGFTRASEHLAPDAIQEILNQFISGMVKAVQAHGGTVIKTIGDSVMAAFGAPTAHEDDADRAAGAALDILRLVERTNAELSSRGLPTFPVRIGINSGEVWVGEIEIAPEDYRLDLIGAEVNRASRSENQAEPGTILITHAVRQRFKNRYVLEEKGLLSGKHGREGEIAEEIPVFQLQRRKEMAVPVRARGEEQVSFIGRERELAQVRDAFDTTVAERKPQLVVIAAEAGQGKSRLGQEFFSGLEASGVSVSVYTAQGTELAAKPPYAALAGAIRKKVGIEADDNLETQRGRLDYYLQLVFGGSETERAIRTQLIGNLLGIDFPEPAPEMTFLLQNPSELRERTREAVVELFKYETETAPVILALEDLHWIDTGSLRFAEALLSRLKDRPFFVLGLTRPAFADGRPSLMEGKDYPVTRIDLKVLDDSLLSEMVDEILGERSSVPVTEVNRAGFRERDPQVPAVRNFLVTQSDRNPFLLQEMARAIRDGWQIEREPASREWQFSIPASPHDAPGRRYVPVGPQAFLQARFDAFSRPYRFLLKCASVAGAEFTVEDLQVIRIPNLHLLLPELVRRRALVDLGGGRYGFPHALLRDTIYEQLQAGEKRTLHRRRASYLQEGAPATQAMRPDELKALVAYHLEQGQDPSFPGHNNLREEAADHYREAAKAAYDRGANVTAAHFYERASLLTSDPEKKVRALLGEDEALYSDKKHDKQLEIMVAAETIIDHETMDHLLQAEVRNQYSRVLRLVRQADEAERQAKKGLALFRKDENHRTKAQLLMVLGANETENRRDYQKGFDYYNQAVRVAQGADDKKAQLMALSNIVHIGLHTGNYSLSIDKGKEALRVYDDRDPGVLRNKLILDNSYGSAFMNIGAYEEAVRIFQNAIDISSKRTGGFYLDYLLPNLARTLSLLGSDEALAKLDEAIAIHAEHPNEFMAGVTHLYTSLAYIQKKDWERARTHAAEALRVASVNHDDKLAAMAQMASAQVLRGEGKTADALTMSQYAYELLERFEWQIEEFDLEILLTHTQLLMEQDRMSEAWAVIDQARQILHERAGKITNPEQRQSFLNRVRVNREIEKYWGLLRSASTETQGAHLARLIARLSLEVPTTLPRELAMIDIAKPHEVSAAIPINGDQAAGTLIERPIFETLKALLIQEVTVPKNTGPIEQIWAEDIHWRPFFDGEGNPVANIEFTLKTKPLHGFVLGLIQHIGGFPNEYHLRLQGRVREEKGVVTIELDVAPGQMLTEKQFGRVTFMLAPTEDGKTRLALKLRNRIFTTNPDVILRAFVESLVA